MAKIVIFGATSAIAYETAKCFANKKSEILLLGRDMIKLDILAADLCARSPKAIIKTGHFDAIEMKEHEAVFDSALAELGSIDAALIAFGSLPDEKATEKNISLLQHEYTTNATAVISIASVVANYFEEQNAGTLAVISSVAGDRGRQSNYIYGSAKAAVSAFLQGLRNRFGKTPVKIITIKPGMVDTPMTAHLKKGLLFASARTVGEGIFDAMTRGKEIVYLPGYWRLVMFIVKHIPESIFKKLSL